MYQVIIADDEAKIRSGLANLFPWNQLGFEIAAVCSNGKEALDFAMENPVDPIYGCPLWMVWSCPGCFCQKIP